MISLLHQQAMELFRGVQQTSCIRCTFAQAHLQQPRRNEELVANCHLPIATVAAFHIWETHSVGQLVGNTGGIKALRVVDLNLGKAFFPPLLHAP